MFTGIVQGTAKVVFFDEKPCLCTYVIELPECMLEGIEIGASLSCNGCCLTITKITGNLIAFDLVKETLRLTNLGELIVGNRINVERTAKFSDEIGGHMMSGHIMFTSEIIKIIPLENSRKIWFKIKDPFLMKYILYKGYIGIDGISLTVGEIVKNYFCVHLIPETLRRTTLGTKIIGQRVNIEIDLQTQTIVDTIERICLQKKNIEKEDINILQ